ncbi:MAG: DUF3592 domain-containing protein [Anaerolineales bacterium]|nr:DUF3592 domain-containing protein [Anaerolineales bacterium]
MASSGSYSHQPRARLDWRLVLRKAAGGLLLLIGLGLLIYSGSHLARDVALWAFGRHVQATVVDLWVERSDSGESDEMSFNYFLRYQFATPDGRIFERVSPASALEWSNLSPGEPLIPGEAGSDQRSAYPASSEGGNTQVEVLYFPLYPQHNRLDDTQYIPILACLYAPLLALAFAAFQVGVYLIGRD